MTMKPPARTVGAAPKEGRNRRSNAPAGGVDSAHRQWIFAHSWVTPEPWLLGTGLRGFVNNGIGGGAGRAGTLEVYRPLLAARAFSPREAAPNAAIFLRLVLG